MPSDAASPPTRSLPVVGAVQRVRRKRVLLLLMWLVTSLVRHRRTRPEPLPPPPAGSTTVTTRDGSRLHVQVGGRTDAGLTVVLVHGFLARTVEFDLQWQRFADEARLVRYDHRNHGRSDSARRSVDVRTLADDLRCVLEKAVPEGPVVLVGHSMGGMTVLALADRHPELFDARVAGVGLLSSSAGHALEGQRLESAVRFVARRRLLDPWFALLRLLAPALEQVRPRRSRLMRRAVVRLLFGTADADPATVAMTQELLEGPPLSTLASLQGALLRHDARAVLPRLRSVPVLVLTGADDRLVRPEHSCRLVAELGSDVQLVVIPGAGHVVNQTRPDETNAEIARLLERTRASLSRAAAVAEQAAGV